MMQLKEKAAVATSGDKVIRDEHWIKINSGEQAKWLKRLWNKTVEEVIQLGYKGKGPCKNGFTELYGPQILAIADEFADEWMAKENERKAKAAAEALATAAAEASATATANKPKTQRPKTNEPAKS